MVIDVSSSGLISGFIFEKFLVPTPPYEKIFLQPSPISGIDFRLEVSGLEGVRDRRGYVTIRSLL